MKKKRLNNLNKNEEGNQAAGNVIDSIKGIEEAIYKFPLSLLQIEDKELLKAVDTYLPFSVGMEFECHKKEDYNIGAFEAIPNIVDIDVDNSEQRYRIPKGLNGLVCLYNICLNLKRYSQIDPGSSNHYHFDHTFVKELLTPEQERLNKPWILEELKTWKTAFDYNNIEGWIRFNSLGTLEIRIGEPTFEYEVIIKRLIQGCNINKQLISNLKGKGKEIKLLKLKSKLKQYEKNEEENPFSEEEIKKIINQRNIKL